MGSSTAGKRFAKLVTTQHGRITRAQLHQLGVSDRMVQAWTHKGRLHRVLPKVYAVGHTAPSREADLWAAILYAGPGAMLSHGTAAHWQGLIIYPPSRIEVSTPRKSKSIAGIRVYGQRTVTRESYEGVPVTGIPQTVIDLAGTQNVEVVRRALAVLDYRHQLDVEALTAICGRGYRGTHRLRQALKRYEPELAHTNGEFELRFLLWCERWSVPVPQFNRWIHGIQVDAHWPGTGLAVELDGGDNHSSRAQRHRDKQSDLTLRRHGMTVYRYDWDQLRDEGRFIRDEILARLTRGRPRDRPPTP